LGGKNAWGSFPTWIAWCATLAEVRVISGWTVHHQGGIDQQKLNGDMKNRHRDLLNTKQSFFVEKLQRLFTFGNGAGLSK
jgi:hypothetical protein